MTILQVPKNYKVPKKSIYRVGRAGTISCLILLLTILDALTTSFREPLNVFSVLPGNALSLNGPAGKNQGIKDLDYLSSSPMISLYFDEIQKGFWFGGKLWQGRIFVKDGIKPGTYMVKVFPKGSADSQPASIFQIRVFPNQASLNQSSKSFLRRWTGISPWIWVGSFLFLTIIIFGSVFYLSKKMEALLIQDGVAEIYRFLKRDSGYEITFGLGSRHGLHSGSRITIRNGEGETVGVADVIEVNESDARALVETNIPVRPGFMVSIKQA